MKKESEVISQYYLKVVTKHNFKDIPNKIKVENRTELSLVEVRHIYHRRLSEDRVNILNSV